MYRQHRHSLAIATALLATSFAFPAFAGAQSVTSTVYDSYLQLPNVTNQAVVAGFNAITYAPVPVNIPQGFQGDYVTGDNNAISLINTGIEQAQYAQGYAGPFSAEAWSEYGTLHSLSDTTAFTDGYFQVSAQASFNDTFTVTSSNFLITPTYAQFVFDADGVIIDQATASLTVDSSNTPPSPHVLGNIVSNGLGAFDEISDGSGFIHYTEDDFQFSGFGSAELTTQEYALNNGSVEATISLNTLTNPEALGYNPNGIVYDGAAGFENTAVLSNILVYDQNGDLIPQSDLTFTDASGATYAFMGGAPAPESSSVILMSLGVAVVALRVLTVKRRSCT